MKERKFNKRKAIEEEIHTLKELLIRDCQYPTEHHQPPAHKKLVLVTNKLSHERCGHFLMRETKG